MKAVKSVRTQIDTHTKLCAVIGNPVSHSLSPVMHNAAFQETGLNYVYLAFAVKDVAGCVSGMRAMMGFRGLSVTIPHKIEIMNYLDEMDDLARYVGCVNTVINDDGVLKGTITDGLGALRAFERAGICLNQKSVLFIGTGGAARAVAFAMALSGKPSLLRIVGRTPAHVDSLVNDLRQRVPIPIYGGSLADTDTSLAASHDILINSTPVGMYGHSAGVSSAPRSWLRSGQIVFDMVYRPRITRLLQEAEAVGATIIPGLEMLLYQAALQFELWTSVPAPEYKMRCALEEVLKEMETS